MDKVQTRPSTLSIPHAVPWKNGDLVKMDKVIDFVDNLDKVQMGNKI
jgi:hypothetical protein